MCVCQFLVEFQTAEIRRVRQTSSSRDLLASAESGRERGRASVRCMFLV